MNTLLDQARSALFRDRHIVVTMESGAEIRFPVAENPRLAGGTIDQLNNIVISPFGLHWPELVTKTFVSRVVARRLRAAHGRLTADGTRAGPQRNCSQITGAISTDSRHLKICGNLRNLWMKILAFRLMRRRLFRRGAETGSPRRPLPG